MCKCIFSEWNNFLPQGPQLPQPNPPPPNEPGSMFSNPADRTDVDSVPAHGLQYESWNIDRQRHLMVLRKNQDLQKVKHRHCREYTLGPGK